MEKKEIVNKKETKNFAPSFTKAQLISSKRYENRKDALNVLLSDDKFYTFEETDRLLNNFLTMKVSI